MCEPEKKLKVGELCRLCMCAPSDVVTMLPLCNLTCLPNGTSIHIHKLIKDCTSLDPSAEDGLPANVCSDCLTKMMDWHAFKENALRVDCNFKQIFKESREEDIKSSILKITDVKPDSASDVEEDADVDADHGVPTNDDDDDEDDRPLSEMTVCKRNRSSSKSKQTSESGGTRAGRLPKTKPYCGICDFKFTRFSELRYHQETVHNENSVEEEKKLVGADPDAFSVYRCHVCRRYFNDRTTLRRHCREAHDLKVIHPYRCNQCDRQFPSWGLLVVHERKHTGEKPYACDICGKDKFISLTSVRRHKLIHMKTFSCDQCGRDFNCDSALKAHIRCKHTNERPFLCNICGRSFGLAAILNAHMTSHSQERKYTCDVCGFASKTSGNHHRHRMRHMLTGEKLFHCETCGKAFETKLKLSSHQIIHRPNRPHVCKLCGKAFLYNNKLERHVLLVHARQRPFSCDICGRKLASKFGLGIHLKTHLKTDQTKASQVAEQIPEKEQKPDIPPVPEQTENVLPVAHEVQPIQFEIHHIHPVSIHHVQLRIMP